jgi:hypothetical protein
MIAVNIPLQRLSLQVFLYLEKTVTVKGNSGQYVCSPSSPGLLPKEPEISLHPAQERKVYACKEMMSENSSVKRFINKMNHIYQKLRILKTD